MRQSTCPIVVRKKFTPKIRHSMEDDDVQFLGVVEPRFKLPETSLPIHKQSDLEKLRSNCQAVHSTVRLVMVELHKVVLRIKRLEQEAREAIEQLDVCAE